MRFIRSAGWVAVALGAVVVLFVGAGTAAALCKYQFDCHVRPTEPAPTGIEDFEGSGGGTFELTDGFVDVFQLATGGTGPELFGVEDGTEVHVGGEYLFTNLATPIAVRAGVWRDPAHSIVYSGSRQDFQALFRERESSYLHSAFGAGFVVQQLEVNVGVDLSKLVKTFSLSAVVRF